MERSKQYQTHVVFQVENVLHRLTRSRLEALSPIFRDMFSVPQPEGGESEGCSDNKPIVLEGYKNIDFERLIALLYPSDDLLPGEPLPITTKDEWTSVLKLAMAWEMEKVRKLAIDRLSEMDISATEKIQLGREYRVVQWFSEGIHEIASVGDIAIYPVEDLAQAVGWETAARLLWVRNRSSAMSEDVSVDLSRLTCVHSFCKHPVDVGKSLSCTDGHSASLRSPHSKRVRLLASICRAALSPVEDMGLLEPSEPDEGTVTEIERMFADEIRSLS